MKFEFESGLIDAEISGLAKDLLEPQELEIFCSSEYYAQNGLTPELQKIVLKYGNIYRQLLDSGTGHDGEYLDLNTPSI